MRRSNGNRIMRRCLWLCLLCAVPLLWHGARAEPLPRRHMVAAANRLAAEAGLAVLRDGGSAADAAVAVQAMLTLVEPQASGFGGGAVALYFDAATHHVSSWDGRETAPAAVRPDLFLERNGQPLSERDAAVGGRAVGVPGTLRMLEALQKEYGKRPWPSLFAAAIRLADAGFAVPPRLAQEIAEQAETLRHQRAAHDYFMPGDTPLAAGALLVNHPLADLLRAIAAGGADALNRGPIAADIAATVRTDPNGGLLTADDLAAYQPKQRDPICRTYRNHFVCSMGPPSGGGVAVLQILGLLSHFDMAALDPAGADAAQALIEAERLANTDRDRYLADIDFVPVPLRGLLAEDYLLARAQGIDLDHANPAPRAGNPDWDGPNLAPQPEQPEHGTSQVVIVDDAGNAISMTTTVQDPFGSRLLVHGAVLNDELTDFSFLPARGGRPVANRVEPGKRPRSSMAPVLVFDADGRLRIVTGSPGGLRIVLYVAQALVGMLDWDLPPQAAIAAPHVGSARMTAELEAGTSATSLSEALVERGQHVDVRAMRSAAQTIEVTPEGLIGAADPRGEGVALGE